MTAKGSDPNLLVRVKVSTDNVEPSGTSVAAMNLLKLSHFTDNKSFRAMAEKSMKLFGQIMDSRPSALPHMLLALDYHLSKPKQIIIVGDLDSGDTKDMLKMMYKKYIPNKVVMLLDGGKGGDYLKRQLPFLKNYKAMGGKATAYVCVDYVCKLPTSDLKTFVALLN